MADVPKRLCVPDATMTSSFILTHSVLPISTQYVTFFSIFVLTGPPVAPDIMVWAMLFVRSGFSPSLRSSVRVMSVPIAPVS